MAERGEGSAPLGGSQSRTTSSQHLLNNTRSRSSVVGLVEHSESSPLPLRKRKYNFTDCDLNKSEGLSFGDTISIFSCNSSHNFVGSSKRRRLISGSGTSSDSKEGITNTGSQKLSNISSTLRRQKRDSAGDISGLSLLSPSFSNRRRSSRGSYPIGFYAEEEQRSLAAFRDRTFELKSKGESPFLHTCINNNSPTREQSEYRCPAESCEQEGSEKEIGEKSKGKENAPKSASSRNRNKRHYHKMTEKCSYDTTSRSNSKVKTNSNEHKQRPISCASTTAATEEDSFCLSQRPSRRHTLPPRTDRIAMGLNFSKCLAVPNSLQQDNPNTFESNTVDIVQSNRAHNHGNIEPSTSRLPVDGGNKSNSTSSTPTMFDHLMRRLPRKKKSNSHDNLAANVSVNPNPHLSVVSTDISPTEVHLPSTYSGDLKNPKMSSMFRRYHETNQRRSATFEQLNGKEVPISIENATNEYSQNLLQGSEFADMSGEVIKSYPLRNRLRLSDGGEANNILGIGTAISGSNYNSVNSMALQSNPVGYSTSRYPLQPPIPSHLMPVHPISTSHPHHPQLHQTQSLPSSPSSPGVAFLDTFRRLRDSRRLSHENQHAVSKRGQSKDNKQSLGYLKRSSGLRKSPLSSKRGNRPKSSGGSIIANNSQIIENRGNLSKSLLGSDGNLVPASAHSLASGQLVPGHQAQTTPVLSHPIMGTSMSLTTTTSGATLMPQLALNSLGAIGSESVSGTSASSSNHLSSSFGGALSGLIHPGDSESDDSEMGRLEALLASRGLPPSLFGALGPRMQHILHRSVSSSISTKAQQLLIGLQASGDESEQLQAVIEMCQLLVMGNEDTLVGFPIKQVTPALLHLLNMEHNFDMMNHACRALTYMMEALPRSSSIVAEGVPAFLEKLQVIQCMDVAEQSLTALNMLSRKHSKSILQAHGVAACLTYIDFFSSNAQRAALSITANCFQNLTADEFHFASDSLLILSSRLTTQGDKKCVESVCLAYSRLVDCFQHDPNRLQEIAGHGLLGNIQQLLVMSPPVLSSGTFIMVIRMLSLMCCNCPDLAVDLLKNNIAETLCYLLTNSTEPPLDQVELIPRSPQELYEITCLIGELLPILPNDGIFSVDSALHRPLGSAQEVLVWQWQDDRRNFINYSSQDSRVIELAHQSGEDEISLCINGTSYTLDFHSMQQINDSTGSMRSVIRRMVTAGSSINSNPLDQSNDARSICLKADDNLSSALIKSLFSLLYEVYSSSAGPAVRYKCLRALLRMVHFSAPDLLQQVLKSQVVSSHLATMLSSSDTKIIVGALQMSDLLMRKLPQIFAIYFRREGVMHQIKRLADPNTVILQSTTLNNTPARLPALPNSSTISSPTVIANRATVGLDSNPPMRDKSFTANCLLAGVTPSVLPASTICPTNLSMVQSIQSPPDSEKLTSQSQMRLSDVLKRKRSKTNGRSGGSSGWRRGRHEEHQSPTFSDFIMKNTGFSSSRGSNWRGGSGGGGRAKLLTPPNNTGSSVASTGGRTASFLANFNPVRWGRSGSPAAPLAHSHSKDKSSPSISNIPVSIVGYGGSSNREYIRNWIREQGQNLERLYFSTELQGCTHPALTVLNRLIVAINQLEVEPSSATESLSEIKSIVFESDISPFEVIHSGLVKSLLNFLTVTPSGHSASGQPKSHDIRSSHSATEKNLVPRVGVISSNITILPPSTGSMEMLEALAPACSEREDEMSPLPHHETSHIIKVSRESRIRNFLHVFLGCSANPLTLATLDPSCVSAFSALITKLNGCVNQLEQFPVKVHDLPGSALAGSGRSGSTSAIKFFNTHQLKCNLQRHPSSNRLRQWRGGPVKVDPLALVQAIERYLVIRGYGRLRDDDEDNSDDDNSDEDIDDTLAAVTVNQNSSNHKLQFLIGEYVLPYNMTVYQAMRQYSHPDASASDDTDAEIPISHSSIWLQTHTIYYRPLQEESSTKLSSGRKGKSGNKPSPKKKGDLLFSEKNIIGGSNCILENHLNQSLPDSVVVKDPSLEVLALLRVLCALNRHYGSFYPPSCYLQPLQASEFINAKLTAKANRQLQDPLVIMTGNLPQWLPQIAYACPFLFPFESRQLLFYAVSFDRDRALQRLMDTAPELNSSDSSERVTPKLERRKRTVSREDILRQAESVMSELGSSRAMLEIQYENEVGTGLGPTLEFYALVSRELQKADLELWRGNIVEVFSKDNTNKTVKYIANTNGLYPLPVSRSIKSVQVNKLKSKFKFLGKFMAKAVMDSRMLDVGLHECMYKWLLGEERSLGLRDVISLDPALGQTLTKLQNVVLNKKRMEEGKSIQMHGDNLQERIASLTIDGCEIEDLCLNFTLPGFQHIELRKGGADIEVNASNIEQYLHLVIEWLIREGNWRQMEAIKEGFESVFPIAQLQIFYSEELEQLFCGSIVNGLWEMKQLAECCRPDHGYTHNSQAVKFLLEILSEYNSESQRSFLQFVTGSPRLPVGGFRSMSPPLTIVRKTFESNENPDDFLPSVMTCVNYLKLPDYSTKEIMKQKLEIASKEGQHSFHLS